MTSQQGVPFGLFLKSVSELRRAMVIATICSNNVAILFMVAGLGLWLHSNPGKHWQDASFVDGSTRVNLAAEFD